MLQWLLIGAVAAAAAQAAPATAATVTLERVVVTPCKSCESVDRITVRAAVGERNDVEVVLDGATVAVTDRGAPLHAGQGCAAGPDGAVTCRSVGLRDVFVDLGDDDDLLVARTALRADGGEGADRLSVAGFAMLDGGPGDDVLTGGGNLRGGTGADRLVSPAGGAIFEGDPPEGPFSPDVMAGGPAPDTVSYAGRTLPVLVDLTTPGGQGSDGEGDTITGVEDIEGGAAPDVLRGDDGPNRLRATSTAVAAPTGPGDVIDGRGGDDRIDGDRGDDVVDGGDGEDDLWSRGGRDRLTGGDGDDRLAPGDGSDRLGCGAGADHVVRPDPRDLAGRDCERLDLVSGDLQSGPARRARGGGFVVTLHRELRDSPPACAVEVYVVGPRRTVAARLRLRRFGRARVVARRPARRPRGVPAPAPGFVRVVADSPDCTANEVTRPGYTVALR